VRVIKIRNSYCFFLVLILLAGCSVEQNSVTSNFFHNMTAHFNGYFYAKEGALEVEKLILKSLDDDHNKINFSTSKAPSFA